MGACYLLKGGFLPLGLQPATLHQALDHPQGSLPFNPQDRAHILIGEVALLFQMVQPPDCRPLRASTLNRPNCCGVASLRGSSTCSMDWKGRTTLVTSLVLPCQISSTSGASAKSSSLYLGGRGSPRSRRSLISWRSWGERGIWIHLLRNN